MPQIKITISDEAYAKMLQEAGKYNFGSYINNLILSHVQEGTEPPPSYILEWILERLDTLEAIVLPDRRQ